MGIGMLHSPQVIETVAQKLKKWNSPNIVLDPVIIASHPSVYKIFAVKNNACFKFNITRAFLDN